MPSRGRLSTASRVSPQTFTTLRTKGIAAGHGQIDDTEKSFSFEVGGAFFEKGADPFPGIMGRAGNALHFAFELQLLLVAILRAFPVESAD